MMSDLLISTQGNLREDLKEGPGDVLEPLDDLEKF